jgi:hypothetical protein
MCRAPCSAVWGKMTRLMGSMPLPGAGCNWASPKDCKQTYELCAALARNAEVRGSINTLVTEIISHRVAFDLSDVKQAVRCKTCTPNTVDLACSLSREAY